VSFAHADDSLQQFDCTHDVQALVSQPPHPVGKGLSEMPAIWRQDTDAAIAMAAAIRKAGVARPRIASARYRN
jgi:hypothetical protein